MQTHWAVPTKNVVSHLPVCPSDKLLIDGWADRDLILVGHPLIKQNVSLTVQNFLQRGFSHLSIACVKPRLRATALLLPTSNLGSSNVRNIMTSCHGSQVLDNANKTISGVVVLLTSAGNNNSDEQV
jgi:hypothetical protein